MSRFIRRALDDTFADFAWYRRWAGGTWVQRHMPDPGGWVPMISLWERDEE